MTRVARVLLPSLLAATLVLAGCGSEVSELPPGLGPVANVTVALPTACATATGSGALAIGPARAVLANPSYVERQAIGCLPYTVEQIQAVLEGPFRADVAFWAEHDVSNCEAWTVADPLYPVNFVTKEIPHGGIERFYTFELTWRVGTENGDVKVLYGKTAGTVEVPKILGSMVFSTDPDHAGWSRIAMVRQLNTAGHSDDPAQLERWMGDYYLGLKQQLSGVSTAGYCNPLD